MAEKIKMFGDDRENSHFMAAENQCCYHRVGILGRVVTPHLLNRQCVGPYTLSILLNELKGDTVGIVSKCEIYAFMQY